MKEDKLIKLLKQAKLNYMRNIASKDISSEVAKDIFRSDLLGGMIELIGKENKSFSINKKTLHILDKKCHEITDNLDKRISINTFVKWFQKILKVLNISKEDPTKSKILETTQDVYESVTNENYRSKLISKAKVIIEEMKQYDLLDNLANLKKLSSLSDKSINTLLKLIATDLSLNGLQGNHPYRPYELSLRIDNNDIPQRREAIEIITTIASDYIAYTKKPISTEDLKIIKATKAQMQVINFERDSESFKKDSEIKKLDSKMCDIRNIYFVEQLAHSIASDQSITQSTLSRASKFLSGNSNKSPIIEEQILQNLKPHAHLLFKKLTNADEISEFKKKTISMIKNGLVTGFVEQHLGVVNSTTRSSVINRARATRAGSFQRS